MLRYSLLIYLVLFFLFSFTTYSQPKGYINPNDFKPPSSGALYQKND